MVKYQFEIDDEKWDEWKNTVPRSKSLERRLIELIEADTDDRVQSEGQPTPQPDQHPEVGQPDSVPARDETPAEADVEAVVADVEFPSSQDRAECVAAIQAAYSHLQREGTATMREFVREVMPDHPLGYEIPDLEESDRYRGAWWRRVVKPGLEALPDVEKPPAGHSEWRYVNGGR